MAAGIPDQVWRRLDPDAGRLSRRATVRLWVATGAALLLYLGSHALWSTGLVVPHLVWPSDFWTIETREQGIARVDVLIANHGLSAVTVLDVGRSGSGMELLDVDGALPITLDSSGGASFVLTYRITDCDATPRGSWPVTAVVARPWGALTVDVQPSSEWPHWQEYVAEAVCLPSPPE
jgi:hypothetical protein